MVRRVRPALSVRPPAGARLAAQSRSRSRPAEVGETVHDRYPCLTDEARSLKSASAHHHKRIHEPRSVRRHAEPARRREPHPALRAAPRARAQRDGPRPRDRDLPVAGVDPSGPPARGRLRAGSPRRAALVLCPRRPTRSRAPPRRCSTRRRARPTRRSRATSAACSSSTPSSEAGCPSRSPARCTGTTRRDARGNRSPSGIAALLRLGDVLDVGSGDGAAAAYLAPYCRSLVCIDTSPRMIEAARERLAALPDTSARRWPTCTSSRFARRRSTRSSSFTRSPMPSTRSGRSRSARGSLRPGGRLVDPLARQARAARGHGPLRRAPRRLLAADPARPTFHAPGSASRSADVACREAKKPHFEVVLAVAEKPKRQGPPRTPSRVDRQCLPIFIRSRSSSAAASPSSTAPWARPSAPTG